MRPRTLRVYRRRRYEGTRTPQSLNAYHRAKPGDDAGSPIGPACIARGYHVLPKWRRRPAIGVYGGLIDNFPIVFG